MIAIQDSVYRRPTPYIRYSIKQEFVFEKPRTGVGASEQKIWVLDIFINFTPAFRLIIRYKVQISSSAIAGVTGGRDSYLGSECWDPDKYTNVHSAGNSDDPCTRESGIWDMQVQGQILYILLSQVLLCSYFTYCIPYTYLPYIKPYKQ